MKKCPGFLVKIEARMMPSTLALASPHSLVVAGSNRQGTLYVLNVRTCCIPQNGTTRKKQYTGSFAFEELYQEQET